MTEWTPGQESEIAARLQRTSGFIAFPETPDLVAVTRASRLSEENPGRLAFAAPWVWATSAVVLLVVSLVLGFSTTSRDAIGRWLEIPGIRVSTGDDATTVPGRTATRLTLGESTSVDAIAAQLPYPLAIPADFDAPDEVYRSAEPGTDVVSMIWLASDELLAIAETDIGLLFSQFPSTADEAWVEKRVTGSATMHVVKVNGVDALWIEGTHELIATSSDDQPVSRPAANVLSWHVDGITYRIESRLPLESVLAIAESVQPLDVDGT